ncbi:unnamed protein product [Didymodactylos carnosus]|uniref:Uncharacterized protein n=1 Tax=Didymodactylos carnosus TaxID=1234261 RepID=A0A815CJZ6_9BILA|nr:unnamed protein product [Didymodactylos carnosus]CAF4091785.1 unnamed protein product [Didymodactylos carnosus]
MDRKHASSANEITEKMVLYAEEFSTVLHLVLTPVFFLTVLLLIAGELEQLILSDDLYKSYYPSVNQQLLPNLRFFVASYDFGDAAYPRQQIYRKASGARNNSQKTYTLRENEEGKRILTVTSTNQVKKMTNFRVFDKYTEVQLLLRKLYHGMKFSGKLPSKKSLERLFYGLKLDISERRLDLCWSTVKAYVRPLKNKQTNEDYDIVQTGAWSDDDNDSSTDEDYRTEDEDSNTDESDADVNNTGSGTEDDMNTSISLISAGKKTIANRTSKRATPLNAGGGTTATQVNIGKKASVVKAASSKRRPAVKDKQW